MVVHRQYLASNYHRGRYCVIGPSTADEAAFLGRAERESERELFASFELCKSDLSRKVASRLLFGLFMDIS